MIEYHLKSSERIKPGAKYTLYLYYCKYCEYKRITASPMAGPGGTLSCPICRARKEHGPGLESSYGIIKAKTLEIILPEQPFKEIERVKEESKG